MSAKIRNRYHRRMYYHNVKGSLRADDQMQWYSIRRHVWCIHKSSKQGTPLTPSSAFKVLCKFILKKQYIITFQDIFNHLVITLCRGTYKACNYQVVRNYLEIYYKLLFEFHLTKDFKSTWWDQCCRKQLCFTPYLFWLQLGGVPSQRTSNKCNPISDLWIKNLCTSVRSCSKLDSTIQMWMFQVKWAGLWFLDYQQEF